MLCKLATKVNIKGSWPFKTKATVWEENSAATAAKRRGLKCGAKAIKSTSNLSNSNSVNKILRSEFGKFDLNQRKRIQKYLYYKGYYDSAIDGVWGEVTQLAIKEALGNSNNMKNSAWVRKQLYQIKESSSSSSLTNSSNNTSSYWSTCTADPKKCHKNFLCMYATTVSNQWETSDKWLKHVKEAKSQGLTCRVSNGALSSASTSDLTNNTTTQSSAKLCSSDPKVCDAQYLCTYGTKLNKSKRIWETSGQYAKHANEAKSRGFTCNVSNVSSSTSTTSVNTYQSSSSATSSNTHSNYTSSDQNIKQTFTSLNSNDRKTIQSFLKKKGYYSGAIDGQYGINTLRSLRMFLSTAPTKSIKTELDRIVSKASAITTVKKSEPILKKNTGNSNIKKNGFKFMSTGFCVMGGTSPNALTNIARCAHLLAGGRQTVDWDYQKKNGQWVCRRLKGTSGAGQYAPYSECIDYPLDDDRWPDS